MYADRVDTENRKKGISSDDRRRELVDMRRSHIRFLMEKDNKRYIYI